VIATVKIVRRSTLWISGTGPAHDQSRGHLFVVLTDPCSENKVLTVPICSTHKKNDTTCLVGQGDHKFLKHPSYVAYYLLEIREVSALIDGINRKLIVQDDFLDEKIFGFVCAGIDRSQESAPKFRKYYLEQITGEKK
jgi:hypothetical protein